MEKNKKQHICWITASWFLDVDLPIVPNLKQSFCIDWYIITSNQNLEEDNNLIKSQTDCQFSLIQAEGQVYSISRYKFYKNLLKKIVANNYDWYYLDISDLFFLFPLVKKYLPLERITIATHNVSTPKGARHAVLAKRSMNYILNNFCNFHVFSENQKKILVSRNSNADVFHCPLMLKDYGNKGEHTESDVVRFLFFGNILDYKRVDILLQAVNVLENKGITDFDVKICGYCPLDQWTKKYEPLIHSTKVICDIRRIPNMLVSDYFNNSDYFVMPYQDIAQSGAMTVALNYNIPIIASNLDTFKEFLTDNVDGYFFENGNVDDLAKVMENVVSNHSKDYQRLKSNQKAMVDKKLSVKSIVNNYKDYFNKKLNAASCNS